MTNPYEMFGTDKVLESEKGVTLDYGGFKITIHRAGGSNRKYQTTLDRKIKPVRKLAERGLLSEEKKLQIMAETYAETIVSGWSGVKDKNSKALKFTNENCVKLLLDLPDLFDDIVAQSNLIANFKTEIEETDIKN